MLPAPFQPWTMPRPAIHSHSPYETGLSGPSSGPRTGFLAQGRKYGPFCPTFPSATEPILAGFFVGSRINILETYVFLDFLL